MELAFGLNVAKSIHVNDAPSCAGRKDRYDMSRFINSLYSITRV